MPKASTRDIAVSALLVFLLVGCSVDSRKPLTRQASDPSTKAAGSGTLLAEYLPNRAYRDRGRVRVNAQFFEIEGAELSEARSAMGVWRPNWNLARDGCSLKERTSPSAPQGEKVRMRFIDVGQIQMIGPEHRFEFSPKPLPSIGERFSGVVYGKQMEIDGDSSGLNPGTEYRIKTSSRRSDGSFSVALEVPMAPHLELETSFTSGKGSRYVPVSSDYLTLQWRQGKQAGPLFVDIRSNKQHLSCRLRDDGHFQLPVSLLEQMTSKQLELTMRRIRAKTVPIPELGDAEFILSTAESVSLSLR